VLACASRAHRRAQGSPLPQPPPQSPDCAFPSRLRRRARHFKMAYQFGDALRTPWGDVVCRFMSGQAFGHRAGQCTWRRPHAM